MDLEPAGRARAPGIDRCLLDHEVAADPDLGGAIGAHGATIRVGGHERGPAGNGSPVEPKVTGAGGDVVA